MALYDYDDLQARLVQQTKEWGRPTDGVWAFELWWLLSRPDKVPADVARRLWVACGYQPGGGFPLARLGEPGPPLLPAQGRRPRW
jgi:hypothetical protein